MTNKEHILTDENLAYMRDTAIHMGLKLHAGVEDKTGKVIFCDLLNCENCRFHGSDDCIKDMGKWLDEEYRESQEPLPFPINTILEAENSRGHLYVFYYKGRDEHGCHCGSAFREKEKGSFTFDIDTARKVGE